METKAVAALKESNELLRSTIDRHRRTIRILRTIIKQLRVVQAVAHANDEEFKSMCADEVYEHDGV